MIQPHPTKREPTPRFLIEWARLCNTPPQCCHTCEHYGFDGTCAKFGMRPPPEFTQSQGQCSAWAYDAIPF